MLESLTLFFPAYNEEENVGPLVQEALEVLPKVARTFEIIVVNDGSRDRTKEIADQLSAEHPGVVKAIHHSPNRGYGGAVKSGLEGARYEWVFFTDGDRQFKLDELPGFVALAGPGVDMVLGYRKKRSDPPHRLLNAKMYGAMIRLLLGVKVRDLDCAYKLIHRRVIEAVELKSTGALITAELLAKAQSCGFKWVQEGVTHYPRTAGAQTGANLKVILRMFRELFRSYPEIRRYRGKRGSD